MSRLCGRVIIEYDDIVGEFDPPTSLLKCHEIDLIFGYGLTHMTWLTSLDPPLPLRHSFKTKRSRRCGVQRRDCIYVSCAPVPRIVSIIHLTEPMFSWPV